MAILALGGNEEATRLMGLPVDRIKMGVYALSGGLAGLAGVILAARTFTGLPTEGLGWAPLGQRWSAYYYSV